MKKSSRTKRRATRSYQQSSRSGAASQSSQEAAATKVIGNALEGPELVIGLVDAVGTDHQQVIDKIRNCLREYNYRVESVSISEVVIPLMFRHLEIKSQKKMKEGDRIASLMDAGDLARKHLGKSVLAYGCVSYINFLREQLAQKQGVKWPGYARRTAFVIKTLKRPEEVEFLRRVYGPGFYLIGTYTEEERRISRLVDKGVSKDRAASLSSRDSNDVTDYGQKASETFHLADFFLHLGDSGDELKESIRRIFCLVFGHPNITPVFDEYAMFMAFAASLRSSELSRQVGAVVARNE